MKVGLITPNNFIEVKVVKMAGVRSVVDDDGTVISGSSSALIKMIPTDDEKLIKRGFQRKEAKKLFDWMTANLPAGIYAELFDLMMNKDVICQK